MDSTPDTILFFFKNMITKPERISPVPIEADATKSGLDKSVVLGNITNQTIPAITRMFPIRIFAIVDFLINVFSRRQEKLPYLKKQYIAKPVIKARSFNCPAVRATKIKTRAGEDLVGINMVFRPA
jgi:hypothetical protein